MSATTHHLAPSRRQRAVHDGIIAVLSAAVAFPIGLIVAYSGTTTTPPAPVTEPPPAVSTLDGGSSGGRQAELTQQVPGLPDGFWTPTTTSPVVPPRVR